MKREYEIPSIEITEFEVEDVITLSVGGDSIDSEGYKPAEWQ